MNKTLLYILALAFSLHTAVTATAQNTVSAGKERLTVTASSATVRQWFVFIEKECGITLSYNPSLIDLDRKCRTEMTGETTVQRLLDDVLHEYVFRLESIQPGKLAIQIIRKKRLCRINGAVKEQDSKEQLYGAIVQIADSRGRKQYTASDQNGLFTISVPEGEYTVQATYMGYEPYTQTIRANADLKVQIEMKPQMFEIAEVTVKSYRQGEELSELTPASLLAFSNNDIFSQIWILPGVTGVPSGGNMQVDGGGGDENQMLLDGVPVFHPGHMNLQFPIFNGDAVKNIVFHKGFFPTKLEGRLSSVTEVGLKDGNKKEHTRSITLDMPAASVMLEGPIVKDKVSYMASARRSWLDFFDDLLSDDYRMNYSSYDYTAKVSYDISPSSSINAFAYRAVDTYHQPDENSSETPALSWDSQIYKLEYNAQAGRLRNSTAAYFSSHTNKASSEIIGFEPGGHISSGINSLNLSTEFNYSADNIYNARLGAKYSHETYDLAVITDKIKNRKEPINQFSIFYDNLIQVTRNIQIQVGVHFVGYLPEKHKDYYSIQPRFSLRCTPGTNDIIYLNFSKMEQFHHYLKFNALPLPTEFRMPSIEGYKPRSSEHYEAGWKHFFRNSVMELSAYYKTRRNVIALRHDAFVSDGNWANYLMTGNGDSYGVKLYSYTQWKAWMLQISYTYARSREWFPLLPERGKLPSLYDIPHQLAVAISYNVNRHSTLSLGGSMHSGKVTDSDNGIEPEEAFRAGREKTNYRIDAGYTYRKEFSSNRLLLVRCGLYNIVGNPSEEDVLNFYSIHHIHNCMPYGGITFKF